MHLRRIIASCYSSRGQIKGQSGHCRLLASGIAGLLLLATLATGATGCTSLYRRAQGQLPPNVTAELNLRISEAQRAEQITRQAAARLYDDLTHGNRTSADQSGFDRLEAAAFDLERRVLAARDVAEKSGETANPSNVIEHLSQQARSWLEYVQNHRTADQAARLKTLENLLHLQR